MPETAQPRELGPIIPHTPSPIDLGHSQQCGIAQSRPIIRAQEGCLSQHHKGAAQMGGCLFLPSKGAHYLVCLLFWNASILVLITFILHSQSTWTLGSQVQTKRMHKTCNSNCTIQGQIIILFLHNYHFTGFEVTILEMKEPSLSLKHWQGCPTFEC